MVDALGPYQINKDFHGLIVNAVQGSIIFDRIVDKDLNTADNSFFSNSK
jgi:hypothetical protein